MDFPRPRVENENDDEDEDDWEGTYIALNTYGGTNESSPAIYRRVSLSFVRVPEGRLNAAQDRLTRR